MGWTMKRLALVVLAALSAALGLSANETMDWSGFYAGVGISAGAGAAVPDGGRTITTNGVAASVNPTFWPGQSGFVLAGYAHQFDHIVLGIEGEIDLAGAIELGIGDPFVSPGSCAVGTTPCTVTSINGSLDPLGHLRVTAGYAVNDTILLFGSAGVAVARASFTGVAGKSSTGMMGQMSNSPPAEDVILGYTVGLGGQLRISAKMSVRGEATFNSYGDLAVNSPHGLTVSNATSFDSTLVSRAVGFRSAAAKLSLIIDF